MIVDITQTGVRYPNLWKSGVDGDAATPEAIQDFTAKMSRVLMDEDILTHSVVYLGDGSTALIHLVNSIAHRVLYRTSYKSHAEVFVPDEVPHWARDLVNSLKQYNLETKLCSELPEKAKCNGNYHFAGRHAACVVTQVPAAFCPRVACERFVSKGKRIREPTCELEFVQGLEQTSVLRLVPNVVDITDVIARRRMNLTSMRIDLAIIDFQRLGVPYPAAIVIGRHNVVADLLNPIAQPRLPQVILEKMSEVFATIVEPMFHSTPAILPNVFIKFVGQQLLKRGLLAMSSTDDNAFFIYEDTNPVPFSMYFAVRGVRASRVRNFLQERGIGCVACPHLMSHTQWEGAVLRTCPLPNSIASIHVEAMEFIDALLELRPESTSGDAHVAPQTQVPSNMQSVACDANAGLFDALRLKHKDSERSHHKDSERSHHKDSERSHHKDSNYHKESNRHKEKHRSSRKNDDCSSRSSQFSDALMSFK